MYSINILISLTCFARAEQSEQVIAPVRAHDPRASAAETSLKESKMKMKGVLRQYSAGGGGSRIPRLPPTFSLTDRDGYIQYPPTFSLTDADGDVGAVELDCGSYLKVEDCKEPRCSWTPHGSCTQNASFKYAGRNEVISNYASDEFCYEYRSTCGKTSKEFFENYKQFNEDCAKTCRAKESRCAGATVFSTDVIEDDCICTKDGVFCDQGGVCSAGVCNLHAVDTLKIPA